MAQKLQASSSFIDEKKLEDYLMRTFHYSSFKSDEQKEAIMKILERQFDVIVSFPTGCGRSLCYQLPAVANSPKLTIVFCSQIDRIKDQIFKMARFHIYSVTYNPETPTKEQEMILHNLNSEVGNIYVHLLYVTPDVAYSPTFRGFFNQLIKRKRLANVVLDETHCETDWIYGQKSNYKILGLLREMHMHIPWVVITNTACSEIIGYISSVLKLKIPDYEKYRFSMPSFRSNIYYDIVYEDHITNTTQHIKEFIDQCFKESQKPSGMIFCKKSDEAKRITAVLKKAGLNIAPYHAGLKDDEKFAIKNSFMREQIKIIAVTGSFGMKINKSNLNFVIHLGLPSNILEYYHQSGQAGKDGQPAHCRIYLTKQSTLYYNEQNKYKWESMVRKAQTLEQRENASRNLKIFLKSCEMIEFCENAKCKHSIFADYFEDKCKKPQCINKCSTCLNEAKNLDYSAALDERLKNEFCCEQHAADFKKNIYKGVDMYLRDVLERIQNTNTIDSTTGKFKENLSDICSELHNVMELKDTESFSRHFDLLMEINNKKSTDQ